MSTTTLGAWAAALAITTAVTAGAIAGITAAAVIHIIRAERGAHALEETD